MTDDNVDAYHDWIIRELTERARLDAADQFATLTAQQRREFYDWCATQYGHGA